MSTPHDLKNAGLKATLPRLKIINLFEQSKVRHLTAEDVYKQLLAEGLDVGLATVYRVLTQFEQAGLLVRHHFEEAREMYADLWLGFTELELERYLKNAGFHKVETAIVYREQEAPYFETMLATGEK